MWLIRVMYQALIAFVRKFKRHDAAVGRTVFETGDGVMNLAVFQTLVVHNAVGGAVDQAVDQTVSGAVHKAVGGAVDQAVNRAAFWAVFTAVCIDPSHPFLDDFLTAVDQRSP